MTENETLIRSPLEGESSSSSNSTEDGDDDGQIELEGEQKHNKYKSRDSMTYDSVEKYSDVVQVYRDLAWCR